MKTGSARRYRFTIFHKMFLTMLLVSILPLSAIWSINYKLNISQIKSHVDVELTTVVNQLTSYVNGWVDMNKRMLLQNAGTSSMRAMDGASQVPLLESIIQHYNWSYLAFTVDQNGNNVGRSDGRPLTFYGDRSYVKQVIEGERFGKQVLVGKTSGKPAFVLSTGIFNNAGKVQGVLAIAMTISELSELITNTRIGSSGRAFLLDESGRIIAHQSPEFTLTRKDFSRHPTYVAAINGQKSINYVDEQGQQVTAYMQTTAEGWIMVAQQDVAEAYAGVERSNLEALVLLAMTILIVSLVAYLLALRLSRPIQNLTRVANDISRGKMSEEIAEVSRRDELGALAESIQRLSNSVKFAIRKLSEQNQPPA